MCVLLERVRPSIRINHRNTAVSNVALGPLTGTPAMAVPMGFSKGTASRSEDGLPMRERSQFFRHLLFILDWQGFKGLLRLSFIPCSWIPGECDDLWPPL